MAAKIKLVQGDNLPYIDVTIVDENNANTPVDVSGATAVLLHFRKIGSTAVLSTIPCSLPNAGVDGLVRFNFPNAELSVDAGEYEGELEFNFSGFKQTVFDVLRFVVRKQFA